MTDVAANQKALSTSSHRKLGVYKILLNLYMYSKNCLKQSLSKRPKISFQDQLMLNGGQKYYRMLPGEHSSILYTFIKLPFVIKIFVLSFFEWSF